MDIRDYISSGILELYACNALPDQERKEVEAMIAQYPELAAELREIEHALEGMAERTAATPSAGARSAFLNAIEEDIEAAIPDKVRPDKATIVTGEINGNRKLTIYKWLLAACIALLLVSSFLATTYYNRWKNSDARVLSLQQQQNLLASENKVLSSNYESALARLRNPSTKIITLAGTESHPDSKAMVYWDQSSGELVLDPLSLPEHDEDHQYQLWAIQGGKPVDAGVFDISGDTTLLTLKTIPEAEAFAITLEPRGGSEAPTLDQMVVIGKI
ncbi:anti-sigma-K factor RskA [Anseongella ginsenosidimutans]|uniref:Regulator of SigK n=1 Tax=Anseongella ginsenosidimutans TaxID=496056 RepID=A0A4R3KLI3_9SPHI|nr:anti-sigma factor [Anseongella ginsenosidimutans]QEC53797.1 hypothetical protein FRZ59_16610 [Anseongella ginsenosidimutans]TCS84941.1 anti-sigma-K factor RskA [Anseongella ginsenosidimutans]